MAKKQDVAVSSRDLSKGSGLVVLYPVLLATRTVRRIGKTVPGLWETGSLSTAASPSMVWADSPGCTREEDEEECPTWACEAQHGL